MVEPRCNWHRHLRGNDCRISLSAWRSPACSAGGYFRGGLSCRILMVISFRSGPEISRRSGAFPAILSANSLNAPTLPFKTSRDNRTVNASAPVEPSGKSRTARIFSLCAIVQRFLSPRKKSISQRPLPVHALGLSTSPGLTGGRRFCKLRGFIFLFVTEEPCPAFQ